MVAGWYNHDWRHVQSMPQTPRRLGLAYEIANLLRCQPSLNQPMQAILNRRVEAAATTALVYSYLVPAGLE